MKEYRNSRKTRQLIKETFALLLKEKNDISKITVKELVDRADISKSTFYCHYTDIYAVEVDFENEIINLLNGMLEDYNKNHTMNYPTYVRQLIFHLKQNEEMYKKILASDLPVHFIDKLKMICTEAINKDMHITFLSKNPNVRIGEINFITNGTIHMFIDYFKGRIPQTLDEIGQSIIDSMQILYTIKRNN